MATQPFAPGVRIEKHELESRPELLTGVPAFVGYTSGSLLLHGPRQLTHPEQLGDVLGGSGLGGSLAAAVRGFFENGGQQCWLMALEGDQRLKEGLEALWDESSFDLLCMPCLPPGDAQYGLADAQVQLLDFCARRGDCFALLDAPRPGNSQDADTSLLEYRNGLIARVRDASMGALYGPWIRVAGSQEFIPPCGHIAGLFARTDQRHGFSKAPANELLDGVVELEWQPHSPVALNEGGINCLRALPGRGIRVMGTRTLAREKTWRYISVRRLFLSLRRRLVRELAWVAFEPNDWRLWLRLHRELGGLLEALFQQGTLKGDTPEEAFYVKCDSENNPPEVREQGGLVLEIGLAPATPREFIVLHLVQREGRQLEAAVP
jgi:hypothetical protein